ncbi:MAG: polyhydroxyalkanoate synthesis repressor PhaR [Woeseiaceae bacterium]
MSTVRVIKKYPNRRLYDTEESRYITLADVRGLVCNQVEFAVIDKKSGEDITRCVLLQVISEQEQQCGAVLSQEFLSEVIRCYGNAVSGFIANYLEQCLRLLIHPQQPVRRQTKQLAAIDALTPVADIAQMNFNRWKTQLDEPRQKTPGDQRTRSVLERSNPAADRKKAG